MRLAESRDTQGRGFITRAWLACGEFLGLVCCFLRVFFGIFGFLLGVGWRV